MSKFRPKRTRSILFREEGHGFPQVASIFKSKKGRGNDNLPSGDRPRIKRS